MGSQWGAACSCGLNSCGRNSLMQHPPNAPGPQHAHHPQHPNPPAFCSHQPHPNRPTNTQATTPRRQTKSPPPPPTPNPPSQRVVFQRSVQPPRLQRANASAQAGAGGGGGGGCLVPRDKEGAGMWVVGGGRGVRGFEGLGVGEWMRMRVECV